MYALEDGLLTGQVAAAKLFEAAMHLSLPGAEDRLCDTGIGEALVRAALCGSLDLPSAPDSMQCDAMSLSLFFAAVQGLGGVPDSWKLQTAAPCGVAYDASCR